MNKDRLVPVLKTNNRRLNFEFYVEKIGLTVLLEDAGLASLGDARKVTCLEIEELPSNRALQPKGKKKLDLLVFRVEDPRAVEAGLARGLQIDQLYKGPRGWAYLATSPEGDRILIHAEQRVADLQEVEVTDYPEVFKPGPEKLDQVVLEEIHINGMDKKKSQAFYQQLDWPVTFVFHEEQGEYLTAAAGETWDLYQLRLFQQSWDLPRLKEIFTDQETFVPKRENFFLTEDPYNQLELWIQAYE